MTRPMTRPTTRCKLARGLLLAGALAATLAAGSTGRAARAAAPDLVNSQTPWRAYLVQGLNIQRDNDALTIENGRARAAFDPANPNGATPRFSPLPPDKWQAESFDDHLWPRYRPDELADFLGDYGATVSGRSWPTLLCLRTCFGVSDPQAAGDLTISLSYLGGVVAYVNGQEVGRADMPKDTLYPLSPADDYPLEAYTTEDNKTPLPALNWTTAPDPQLLPRYQKRLRTATFTVPRKLLHLEKGRNVLALELHRSPLAGPLHGRGGWSHLGIHWMRLTGGNGYVPYAEAVQGTRLWSADPLEPVTDTPAEKSLVKRNWFHALGSARGMPLKGTQVGNPWDPVRPIRLAVPRNGVASGQAVLTDLSGLHGITASVADLKGPGGAVIPAASVSLRYATQHDNIPYCDALMDTPPENARTVPVWLIVQAPRDAAPGWYTSTLSLAANGKTFTVPVQLLVTGLTLPDAKDFSSHISLSESPETLALQYKVEPYSDAHLKLLEKSYALMGQVGNDVLHIPVVLGNAQPIARSWTGPGSKAGQDRLVPLIRWTRTDRGLQPDFSRFEKVLDLYTKHCAAPEALCLYIWEAACAKEMADAYENRRIPSRDYTPKSPLMVQVVDPKTGQASDVEAPAIIDPDAEAFWKPMLEGVRAIVKKRGWSERCIMLSLGGDLRPGSKTGELLRQWAPYARWDILSHFSGDAGPKDGKMIATGDLEVGLKEYPGAGPMPTARLEELLAHPLDFLELPTIRWEHQEFSPPLMFRTMPLLQGKLTRLGLDFWMGRQRGYPNNTSWFTHANVMTVPGKDGPIPTVRFEQLREGVQDAQIPTSLMQAYLKLPDDQRKPYRELLDEFPRRVAYGSAYLTDCELQYDWPAYVAKLQHLAADLAGTKDAATWDK